MAGQKVRMMQRIMVDGLPIMREIDSWESAVPKKKLADIGGSFIAGELLAGIEKMQGKIVAKGLPALITKMTGRRRGDPITVIIMESWEDEDGVAEAIQEVWTGYIGSREKSPGTIGDLPTDTLVVSVDESRRTTNGLLEWHVSRTAHICDLGSGDLLAKHRSNVGLF